MKRKVVFASLLLVVIVVLSFASSASAWDPDYCRCVLCGAKCEYSNGWFECNSSGNMQDPCYWCELGCSTGGVSCCLGWPVF